MLDLSRTGRLTAYTGAAAQLVGLAWDAVLHRLDPGLAAREGIFTLSNPGHVLFGGGLVLVVVGLGLLLLAGGGRSRVLRFGGAGALGALAVGALLLVSTSEGGLTGHSHDHADAAGDTHIHADGTAHTHDAPQTVLAAGSASDQAGHAHDGAFGAFGDVEQSRHQHQPDIPISAADLTTLTGQLTAARAATEQYQDVRAALRDGYIQMTQDLPGIAAHFVNPFLAARGQFDPAHPEILLYAKQDGRWTLVGLSYLLPYTGTETPPEGFAGPLDVWHYHTDLCFKAQRVISAGGVAQACTSQGGRFVANTGWMAHLWLYSDSPEGVFAHENTNLKGSDAVLTRADLAAMQ
jgi:hypothetical protein